jgi:hypothetical protein
MIDKQILEYLKLGHGTFNTMVCSLLIYQGLLGYRIRKARLAGGFAGRSQKRHRKNGPVLVVLGIAGFFAGMLLVFLEYGHILKYPLHFINGAAIATALIGLLLLSKRIKGAAAPWRRAHFTLGIVTLLLYFSQLLLGLDILF